MVTGRIIISYNTFKQTCVAAIITMSCTGIVPINAIGINIALSAASPQKLESIARARRLVILGDGLVDDNVLPSFDVFLRHGRPVLRNGDFQLLHDVNLRLVSVKRRQIQDVSIRTRLACRINDFVKLRGKVNSFLQIRQPLPPP